MEQVLQDDHLCYVLLNFAGEREEPRARCLSKHWCRLRRRWIASLPSDVSFQTAAFSPDGAIIAAGGGTIYNYGPFAMYDVRSGAERCQIFRPGQIMNVGFLSDGGTVAVASHESVLPLYDTRTGALLQEVDGVALPHCWLTAFAVSRDGAMVAVGGGETSPTGGDETVCIYDAATFERRQAIAYDCPNSVAFSPDGATIAVGGYAKKVSVYEVATGALMMQHDRGGVVHALAFSQDGQVLAAGLDYTDESSDEEAEFEGKTALTLYPRGDAGSGRVHNIACGFGVFCLAFAPNNSVLAVGGLCERFVIYDMNTLKVRCYFQSDNIVGRTITFSPDSSKIALGHKKLALYDIETGDPVRRVP